MSSFPSFSMRELIEAGVHFGHKTKRWNPRMAPFLYGVRNDIHIIDLGKTAPLLKAALSAVRDTTAANGRLLFVGTKRQASDPVAEAAKRCGQYYINQRWLGGLLTNWSTIQNSIRTLKRLEEQLSQPELGFTKKELLTMTRLRDKLESSLGGIKDMGGLPDMLFIIDVVKEDLAVKEAQKLGIPVVAIVDSNASPEGITYPIPGNDDSTRALRLYCQLISDAALAGIQQSLSASGGDLAQAEEAMASGQEGEGEAAPAPSHAEPAEEGGRRSSRGGKRGGTGKRAPVVEVKKAPGRKKTETEE
ncbi:MAG: 30S ribosomal protein S2 [Alphaproteobacteria bacterium]|nr:30S ribosomal protein S2 [Alphaproteobacteria bacterium]